MKYLLLSGMLVVCAPLTAVAGTEKSAEAIEACIAVESRTVKSDKTLGELRSFCQKQTNSAIGRRIALEKAALRNPFAILPHKPNYILPVTYSEPNEAPYIDELKGYHLDDIEAKFQVSVKFVTKENLFFDGLDLQVAFTATSWWQSYNSKISAPFRETNYEPELILSYKKPWSLLGLSVGSTTLSFNHQSNGQSGYLSRSWNRVIGSVAAPIHENIIVSARAWWRLPEDEKKVVDGVYQPKGDDNPNIENYMGYGELGGLWRLPKGHNLDVLLRNNLRSDNKGAVQIGWSFPLSTHVRGYVEYFNGYGESLIYYNHSTERIGLGFKLTDWL